MPAGSFDALERRMTLLFGEEALGAQTSLRLGKTLQLAQQIQEQALQNGEEMLEQAKQHLETLAARRARLLERAHGGGDWSDMDEIHEQLGEVADELSDQLDEVSDAFITWLESQRTELEEQHHGQFTGTRDWRVFQRWTESQIDKAREFADALIEQFDEESAIIAQT